MCWSAEASLNTYLFALFAATTAYVNGYNWRILLYALVFSTMQLAEWGIWSNLKDKSGNEAWSKFAYAVILAEGIVSINVLPSASARTLGFLLYGLFLALTELPSFSTKNWQTSVGPNGHLQHKWLSEQPFGFIMLAFLIVPLFLAGEWLLATVNLVGMLFAAYNYYNTSEFSSMWCFVAISFWFVILGQSYGNNMRCLVPGSRKN